MDGFAAELLRAYVAADGQQPVARVPSEKLFWTVQDELASWHPLGERGCCAPIDGPTACV